MIDPRWAREQLVDMRLRDHKRSCDKWARSFIAIVSKVSTVDHSVNMSPKEPRFREPTKSNFTHIYELLVVIEVAATEMPWV